MDAKQNEEQDPAIYQGWLVQYWKRHITKEYIKYVSIYVYKIHKQEKLNYNRW